MVTARGTLVRTLFKGKEVKLTLVQDTVHYVDITHIYVSRPIISAAFKQQITWCGGMLNLFHLQIYRSLTARSSQLDSPDYRRSPM